MTELKGALYFWADEPHISGFLKVGGDYYEIAGVKRTHVRFDVTGRKIKRQGKQPDLFDERSGDSDG